MFPDIEENLIAPSETNEDATLGTSFLFDFAKGDFVTVDGKIIQTSGIDAVKVWIEKILKTEQFKFKIYETGEQNEYGISLLDFINSDYPLDFVKIEIEREVKEALAKNPEITRVYSFEFSREKRALICNFSVDTIYGTVGGEITI